MSDRPATSGDGDRLDHVGGAAHGRARPGWVRRLYDWVLHWADTPHGMAALFVLALAESSFFPIPPDVMLIPMVIARPAKAWWYATIATAGSVIGGVAGYAIGY